MCLSTFESLGGKSASTGNTLAEVKHDMILLLFRSCVCILNVAPFVWKNQVSSLSFPTTLLIAWLILCHLSQCSFKNESFGTINLSYLLQCLLHTNALKDTNRISENQTNNYEQMSYATLCVCIIRSNSFSEMRHKCMGSNNEKQNNRRTKCFRSSDCN